MRNISWKRPDPEPRSKNPSPLGPSDMRPQSVIYCKKPTRRPVVYVPHLLSCYCRDGLHIDPLGRSAKPCPGLDNGQGKPVSLDISSPHRLFQSQRLFHLSLSLFWIHKVEMRHVGNEVKLTCPHPCQTARTGNRPRPWTCCSFGGVPHEPPNARQIIGKSYTHTHTHTHISTTLLSLTRFHMQCSPSRSRRYGSQHMIGSGPLRVVSTRPLLLSARDSLCRIRDGVLQIATTTTAAAALI
jgi:hypothetical protein